MQKRSVTKERYSVWHKATALDTIQCNCIQYNAVAFNKVRNRIAFDTTVFDTIPIASNTKLLHLMQRNCNIEIAKLPNTENTKLTEIRVKDLLQHIRFTEEITL